MPAAPARSARPHVEAGPSAVVRELLLELAPGPVLSDFRPHKLEVETRPADTLADGPHGPPGWHRTGQAWLPQQWRPPTGPGRAARVLGQRLMFSGLDENQLVLSKPGPGPGFRKGRASQRLKLGSGTA
ncbi:hypothetical protein AB1E18_018077 [Capra hircus]